MCFLWERKMKTYVSDIYDWDVNILQAIFIYFKNFMELFYLSFTILCMYLSSHSGFPQELLLQTPTGTLNTFLSSLKSCGVRNPLPPFSEACWNVGCPRWLGLLQVIITAVNFTVVSRSDDVMSQRQHFTALLAVLQLLHNFYSLPVGPLSLEIGVLQI